MASPNDTVVGFDLPGASNVATSITDADGNVWTITSGGQVAENGVADQTTSYVIALAYVNGEIFQENITNTWWGKTSSSTAWFGAWTYSQLPYGSSISADKTEGITIVDGNGNEWQINSQGQVTVDGVVDQTTSYVIALAYANGRVWQENINDDWWSKSLPTDTWSPGPNPITQLSANNAIVLGTAGSITDTNGNIWSINSSQQVVVNGVVDGTTDDVLELVYYNGQVYQQNINNDWWSKTVPSDAWTSAGNLYGWPFQLLQSSTQGTTVTAGSNGDIVDRAGDVWIVVSSNNGQVAVNGFTDQTTSYVTKIVFSYGEVWQENINGDWWEKTLAGDTWAQSISFPTISPLQGLVMTSNQSIITGLSPDGEDYQNHHPNNSTIVGVGLSNTVIYEDAGDSIDFNGYLASNSNNGIIMGSGTETIDEGAETNTIYGGSGTDTINASVGLNVSVASSGLTFIGGSGTNTAYNVEGGWGGSGQTTMYGANNSTLFAGSGTTFFGLMDVDDVMTIDSFYHGIDKIISGGANISSVLATEIYANGVAELQFGTSGQANVFVHTNSAIVANDFT